MSDALRDVFNNEVIRASAGTGKTFELSNRFLQLLASGADCETILATTFTRKGAGEILDRIVLRLSQAALNDDASALLAEQLGWKMDRARVQDLLRELIQNLHRLQIGTLDAFFYRIAQSFRLEMGLPTQWQIVNERQIAILHDQIINEILHDKSVVDILHMMTKGDAQRRIANLIRSTVDRLYDIRVQSDREAWNKLEMPQGFSFERDFGGLCEEIVSLKYPDKRQLKRIEKDVELVENQDWLELATTTIFENILAGEYSYYRKQLPDRCIEIYKQWIAQCRGVVVDMLIRKNSSTFDLLDIFGQKLEAEKTESGQLRFDDINVRLEGFIGDKETEEFVFRLDHNVDHLLLDEFQDTSISQWNVIEPFAARTTEDNSRRSFFCVGDLKQAIFGWRGGVAEIFDAVESNLSNMSSGRHLTKSYRSSQVIVDSVNKVFGNLGKYRSSRVVVQDTIERWSERFEIHETARDDLAGYFGLEFAAESDQKGLAKHPERNTNTLVATVHRIKELHQKMPGKSIGVLVRKNDTIGELIYMLREAGVSASEEGGNPLTDSAAVETILSLVSLADHPGDSIARFHVSNSSIGKELGLEPETQKNQNDNRERATRAAEELRIEFSRLGYGFAIEKYARVLAADCTLRELSRLQQLVQEAFNYEKANEQARTHLRPSRFVDHIRNEFKASDESSAQVRVMTIHQSKGLEFDVVVLPMLYEKNGWFTHQSTVVVGRENPTADINLVCRLANQSHRSLLPEEFQQAFDESKCREVMDSLCVLYVAMTRAVHATHVVMSYSCKSDQDSSAAVLLATLFPGERQVGTVLELGDANWFKMHPANEDVNPGGDINDSFYLPPNAKVSNVKLATDNQSGRGLQKVTPSGIEGGDQIKMSTIFSTVANEVQLNNGTFVHACFESVSWTDETIPTRKELVELLREYEPLVENSSVLIDQFLAMLEKPKLSQLLSRQNYIDKHGLNPQHDEVHLSVSNERPFAVMLDGKLMHGSIDRLVEVRVNEQMIAAEIVDFKTDDVRDGLLEPKIEHYRPQMDAYRRAVSKFRGIPIDDVSTKLVFVNSDIVVDVQQSVQATDKLPDKIADKAISKQNDAKSDSTLPGPKFVQKQQLKLWSEE